jgi:hypothetical protein
MQRFFTTLVHLLIAAAFGVASALPVIAKQTPDLALSHDGVPATKWDGKTPWQSEVAGGPPAVSGGVAFWLHVAGLTDELVVNAKLTGEQGTMTGKMILRGQGWRRVWLPVRALQNTGTKLEPGLVLELAQPAPKGLVLALTPPQALPSVRGASVGETELLAQIDWSVPGLAAGQALLVAGDRAGALRELARYVRQRPIKWQFVPVNKERLRAQADRCLNGEYSWIGLNYTFPNGEVDWLANHSLGTPLETHEWVWALNRHADLSAIALTYQDTRDPAYARAWARLMRSWIQQVASPAVRDEKPGSAWRKLEAGLRVTNAWFTGFYSVLDSSELSDADIIAYLTSLWDHANFLAVSEFDPTNHFVFGMTGLYTVGSEFPEFRDAKAWRTIATRQLERLLTESTLEDGGWYEMAPGYAQWVCDKIVEMWNNAEATGQTAELSPLLRNKLRGLAEWSVRLLGPDRSTPRVNDGVAVTHTAEKRAWLSARFPDSDLLRWAAADAAGTQAMPPAPAWTSEHLAASGYQVMRTGWSREDSYVLLDTGHLGGWHGHQDALNIVAYFKGRYFLFDNGGYKYDASAWRAWGQTTAAHNTVLVDGLGQMRNWNGWADPIGKNPAALPPARFTTSSTIDYASGWYASGYGKEVPRRGRAVSAFNEFPATHRREVLFVKPAPGEEAFAAVLDTMTPGDAKPHHYEVRWHLKATQWKSDLKGQVTWTAEPGLPNLAVVSLQGADTFAADSAVTQPEILGWWFENQNDPPTPAITLRQSRQSAGVTRLLTLLVPFTGDTLSSPVVSLTKSSSTTHQVVLRSGQRITLRLTGSKEGPGLAIGGQP